MQEIFTNVNPNELSPLCLAYIGDAVHDLYVRTRLLFSGENVRAMHQKAVGTVNAAGMSRICAPSALSRRYSSGKRMS